MREGTPEDGALGPVLPPLDEATRAALARDEVPNPLSARAQIAAPAALRMTIPRPVRGAPQLEIDYACGHTLRLRSTRRYPKRLRSWAAHWHVCQRCNPEWYYEHPFTLCEASATAALASTHRYARARHFTGPRHPEIR
jgi:hypothetical protein